MISLFEICVTAGALIWLGILAAPWRPWSTRENLVPGSADHFTAADLTVLIPARNEAASIARTLTAIRGQAPQVQIILVDDQSDDGTTDVAAALKDDKLTIVRGEPMPDGWTGKLWALEQGFRSVSTDFLLLLDADITLAPGVLREIRRKMDQERIDFLSIMARLRMENPWEKLLMPAFVFFFKLLYPFGLANGTHRSFAAAAGGCIATRVSVIRAIGGFSALRGELIDDCRLAKRVKREGYRTWIGLSHAVISTRRYENFQQISDMVARTAFTQLRYSWALLGLCTVVLGLAAWSLPLGIVLDRGWSVPLGLAGITAMIAVYVPTLKYYGLSTKWAAAMPIVATLYLYMTWLSALRHLRGTRSTWKGRAYSS